MISRSRSARMAMQMVVVLACTSVGCATIVGADFDVSARPDPSPIGPSNGGTGGIEGPHIDSTWSFSGSGQAQLLGLSVAVEGNTALVGARNKDWAGQVFVVKASTGQAWDIQYSLTAGLYASPNARFGSSVALSGDWAIIGASAGADEKRAPGAAYFFHRVGDLWNLEQEVKASGSGVDGDRFGTRVAIEDDVAVVGAPGPGGAGAEAGAVHVFRLGVDGTWTETQRLIAPDGMAGDSFGYELALKSTTLVVGAPFNDEAGIEAGAAYVFERSGADWNPVPVKLGPRAAEAPGARMGLGTIGLEDGLLLVPAAERIEAFERDPGGNWVQDTLTPPGGLVATLSSWRATIHGNRAILAVGTSEGIGMGLLYDRAEGDWKFVERLESGSSGRENLFGWTIAYDGVTACFGAIFSQDRDGTVYFFDLSQ